LFKSLALSVLMRDSFGVYVIDLSTATDWWV